MNFRVRKTDSRNQLFMIYRYQLVCNLPVFFDMREWCWEQWGPGIEYEHYTNMLQFTEKDFEWAWDSNKYNGAAIKNCKLYLKDEQMLSHFSLVWS